MKLWQRLRRLLKRETQPAEAAAEAQTTVTKVEATDVVNVRSSDSEQAERLGKVAVGEVLKLLEKKENGWSKVEYNGKEGYIKSEYLKRRGRNTGGSGRVFRFRSCTDGRVFCSTTSTSSDLPASGKIKIAQTINIRKACSETADKIGTAFPGETLEIVMQQADGWTRVKYNGETGCKDRSFKLKIIECTLCEHSIIMNKKTVFFPILGTLRPEVFDSEIHFRFYRIGNFVSIR